MHRPHHRMGMQPLRPAPGSVLLDTVLCRQGASKTERLTSLHTASSQPQKQRLRWRRPRAKTPRAMCSNYRKESLMDMDLELIDLGDAKEETKGWNVLIPTEEEPGMPFGRE